MNRKYCLWIFFLFTLSVPTLWAADISLEYEPSPIPIKVRANSWAPTGAPNWLGSEKCQGYELANTIQALGADIHRQGQAIKKLFRDCRGIHSSYGSHGISDLTILGRIRYDFVNHPLIRPVKITISETFENNREHTTITRGLLALKNDDRPRPMVVIKTGIFSSTSSEKAFLLPMFLMHLFDETPFNVLLLNSDTGNEYHMDNRRLSMGGFNEGRQVEQVARWLRTPQSGVSDRISSLHLVGMSNGGHAVLYAAAYSERKEMGVFATNPIDSVMALCSVVNLQRSMEYALQHSGFFISGYFRAQTKNYLRRAAGYVPGLRERIARSGGLGGARNLINISMGQLLSYYKTLTPEWYFFPFQNDQISHTNKLWSINNFIGKSSLVKVPTLVWSSQNDKIIEYFRNAGQLKTESQEQDSNIAVLGTRYGNHCMHLPAFGWGLTSRILKSYILSHSPEFSVEKNTMPVNFSSLPSLVGGVKHTVQEWRAAKNSSGLKLTFYTTKMSEFRALDVEAQAKTIVKHFEEELESNVAVNVMVSMDYSFIRDNLYKPLATIAIPYTKLLPLNITVPTSDAEAESLTRWLNTNVELLTLDKFRLHDSSEKPMYIRWQTR